MKKPERAFFKKESRLLTAKDFEYLKKGSLVTRTPFLSFYYKKSKDPLSSLTRIGISISAKTADSHKRNRLKRILKELFRQSSFKNLGLDILMVVHPPLKEDLPFWDIKVKESFFILGERIAKKNE
ncbi:MAG: ribonuclease P protein component [Bacteriovoracaceae bacterium]|nr:ribonuclease P protein component [Bacteriovoracaceae bacterium]